MTSTVRGSQIWRHDLDLDQRQPEDTEPVLSSLKDVLQKRGMHTKFLALLVNTGRQKTAETLQEAIVTNIVRLRCKWRRSVVLLVDDGPRESAGCNRARPSISTDNH